MSEFKFECSRDLKQLFNQYLDKWSAEHPGGLNELARRCGVSAAYLSHVKRYGRIPGRPVLTLLAINFGLRDPSKLFEAAQSSTDWPYSPDENFFNGHSPNGKPLTSRIEVSTDVAESIRQIVRNGTRPRTIFELTQRRPLRIGLNASQRWLSQSRSIAESPGGFLEDLPRLISSVLRHEVETREVSFADHSQLLEQGEIDIFGPVLSLLRRSPTALYTEGLFSVGLSALWRKSIPSALQPLRIPRTAEELEDPAYTIAVMKNARGHLIANTRFRRSDSNLILCGSLDEAVRCVSDPSAPRPAHLCLLESGSAQFFAAQNISNTELIFADRADHLDTAPNRLAVRSDWPELVPILDEAISFLRSSGSIPRGFENHSLELAQAQLEYR